MRVPQLVDCLVFVVLNPSFSGVSMLENLANDQNVKGGKKSKNFTMLSYFLFLSMLYLHPVG